MDAGSQERRANKDEERNVKEEEVMLWDLEKTQFLSCQLPPLPQTSIQILAPSRSLRARPSCPAFGAPQIAPNRCQAPSPPAPGQPAGRTRRGQHTLPTLPEINISRETELVLFVFTAKDQAGWWGRGPLEDSCPWSTASSPALLQPCLLCAQPVLASL